MLTSRNSPTDRSGSNRAARGRRGRAGTSVVVALALLSLVASACGSSTKVTASADSTPNSQASGTKDARAPKGSGPLAQIAGSWTSVNGDQARFCEIGSAIPGPGEEPVTTQLSSCATLVDWGLINRVDVAAGGQVSISFSYQGIGQQAANEPDDAFHEGTCEATAKLSGEQLRLDGLVCIPAKGDVNAFQSSGLTEAKWKLDGSCLEVDNAWFEQSRGECKDHHVEQKFGSVGNAISNAS